MNYSVDEYSEEGSNNDSFSYSKDELESLLRYVKQVDDNIQKIITNGVNIEGKVDELIKKINIIHEKYKELILESISERNPNDRNDIINCIENENDRINQFSHSIKTVKSFYKLKREELEKLIKSLSISEKRNCFLLRGNPGLGKTSFIIYLLLMLKEYSRKLKIYVCKNGQNNEPITYQYVNGVLQVSDINSTSDSDIIITDSFDYNKNINNQILVLYISSPDNKNYRKYDSVKTENKSNLYLDIFSNDEIKEWCEFCLPPNLKDYIEDNNLAKKYGNIPRHIYFASLYHEYYNKDYYEDIYSKGINTVIGNNGFYGFIKKYILPLENMDKKKCVTELNIFDITLCHYIIKYSYENLFTVSTYKMDIISDEIVKYIFESIHHLSKESEIEIIKELFFNHLINEYDNPLYRLVFQEFIFCKCLYHSEFILNACKYNEIDVIDIHRITDEKDILNNKSELERFKELFNCTIYKTNKEGIFFLQLITLKNGEVIYLMNNCFIHVSMDNCCRFEFDDVVKYNLKLCVANLKRIFELNECDVNNRIPYYFISLHAKGAKMNNKKAKEYEDCSLSDNNQLYFNETELEFYSSDVKKNDDKLQLTFYFHKKL